MNIEITKITNSRLSETDFSDLGFGKTFSDHMFIADYTGGEWRNFRIVPFGNITISPAASVFHYGQAFFEGVKAYKHADGQVSIFRPYKNAARFNRSAARLCAPKVPEQLFVEAMARLIDLDREWVPQHVGNSLYIRPFMIATDALLGVRPSDEYQFMILTGPSGAYFPKPLNVKIETHYTRACEGGIGFAKAAGNYAGALMPSQLAHKEGFDQLIWTDANKHEYIEEMGAANLMFVLNDTLITASCRDTVLEGVTRDTILELARYEHMNVEERRVSVKEIIEGLKDGSLTEAFGVGTAATIAPIAAITFEGERFQLAEAPETSFSKRTLKKLNDIRYGLAEDTFGWNYFVQNF